MDIGRAPEDIPVLGPLEPDTLALRLAGLAAFGLGAKLLVPPVVAVGLEHFFAMQALTAITFRHGSS
jgi:hypothetical protein